MVMSLITKIRTSFGSSSSDDAEFNNLDEIVPSSEAPTSRDSTEGGEHGIPLFSRSSSSADLRDVDAVKQKNSNKSTSLLPKLSFSKLGSQSSSFSAQSSSRTVNSARSTKDNRFTSTRSMGAADKLHDNKNDKTIFDDDDFSKIGIEEVEEEGESSESDSESGSASESEELATSGDEDKNERNSKVIAEKHMEYISTMFSKARHFRNEFVLEAVTSGLLDINERDIDGNALLHICAQNNNRKLASMLLKAELNADINLRNNKALTPLDYCDKYGFVKMRDWLVSKGARHGATLAKSRHSSFT